MRINDPNVIREILLSSRVIAIVGLSSKPTRPSHGVAEYLQSQGYRIIPVNPYEVEVLGEPAYARLSDIPEKIDVVTIFRRSEYVAPIVEEAIHLRIPAIWMQEGVLDERAAHRALAAGLMVVVNRCMPQEHCKLIACARGGVETL